MPSLAERIRNRREALQMTQEELGELIGKDQKQVWRYETGANQPTAAVLSKIAVALETTTDWLLGLTDFQERPLRGEGDLDDIERETVELLRRQDAQTRKRMLNALKALETA